jgi:hypothetical protein
MVTRATRLKVWTVGRGGDGASAGVGREAMRRLAFSWLHGGRLLRYRVSIADRLAL